MSRFKENMIAAVNARNFTQAAAQMKASRLLANAIPAMTTSGSRCHQRTWNRGIWCFGFGMSVASQNENSPRMPLKCKFPTAPIRQYLKKGFLSNAG